MKTRLLTLLAAATLASAYAQTTPSNLTNGLVAFYPFEGNANDASGSGNNATPAGSFQYLANGLTGGAIRINGDFSQYYAGGGRVMLPTFGSNMNSGFSLSLWVKDEVIGVEPVGAECYINFQAPNVYPHCQITLLNWSPSPWPSVAFEIHSGPGGAANFEKSIGTYPINAGTYPNAWKHLALVSGPGKFACYLNGSKIYETNVFYTNIFPASYGALGSHYWDNGNSSCARMSVTYDNVRIWNRVLTDQEVQQLNAFDQNLVTLGISIKTLRLTMNVELGKSYQLESSTNLPNWATYGSPFVAAFTPIYQDVDVIDGYRYFRLKQLP